MIKRLTCSSVGVPLLPWRLPVDWKSALLPPIWEPRTEPIPDPLLALLNSPSSPNAPLTEGTDVDLINPAEPLPLKLILRLDILSV